MMIFLVWLVGLIAAMVFPDALITAIRTQDAEELKRAKNYATISFILVLATLVVTIITA